MIFANAFNPLGTPTVEQRFETAKARSRTMLERNHDHLDWLSSILLPQF
jgi:hypothetical protein